MNARHSLICFFFLTLRDGNSGLTNAQNLNRRYQCGLDRSGSLLDSYKDIEIRVTDEVTRTPFPTSAPSASTLTITQRLSSVPSSPSSEHTTQPQQGQTAPDGHGVVLYVGLILLAMFIVLSVALLIFCRKRARKELPLETEYVSDTETNQLYEEIREVDRGSSSPPAETSTIYSYAKPNQPNGVESTDEYSLVNAATAQKEETKDDPGNLNYSEDFEIRVTDEVTLTPFPTSAPSASTLTITQSLSSVPSSASPERTTQPQQGQTASDGVVLYVRLTLVVMMFIVLSASVLIFCRKRARKPGETADEAEYVNVTEADRV
ncbi:hypothetical protein CesoFtcFv8_011716 [Champsocephalus esox]|uniref:Uncharacterized protein n=1 Tax=Champsocephalus esox TaxID=159716 RepID=A0AAN8C062_9TELE|nr:hypothetical protein CesoFtcFv8_011716 [Champsocephalus esox]